MYPFVTLTVVTTTVMIVIGNNIALSLGMVGALSIVRFRTAIKGLPGHRLHLLGHCGGNLLRLWGLSSGPGGERLCILVSLFFGRIRNDNRVLLILRAARVNEPTVEALIFQYFLTARPSSARKHDG